VLSAGVPQPGSETRDHYTDLVTNKIVANGQLTWLIKRGDLLLSDSQKETEEAFTLNFHETNDNQFNDVFELPIYEYPDDDIPDRYETAQEGMTRMIIRTLDNQN